MCLLLAENFSETVAKMKFYRTKNGVVVDSNEPFFKALRISLVGIALICIGVLYFKNLMFSKWYFSFALAQVVFILLFMKLSIEIDCTNTRYRQGFRLFKRMTGSWVTVNEFSYISIFPTLGTKDRAIPMAAGSLMTDLQTKELRINLVVNNRKRIMLQVDMELGKARTAAIELGNELGVGVYDCTCTENVWLIPRK